MTTASVNNSEKKQPPKTRYVKGGYVGSLDELARQEFVYFNGKLVHRGWFLNWQFKTTIGYLEKKHLRYAIVMEV